MREQANFAHLECITEITSTIGLAVQVGGGIRQIEQARAIIAAGAERVVIGSTAAQEPDTVINWFGELGRMPLSSVWMWASKTVATPL